MRMLIAAAELIVFFRQCGTNFEAGETFFCYIEASRVVLVWETDRKRGRREAGLIVVRCIFDRQIAGINVSPKAALRCIWEHDGLEHIAVGYLVETIVANECAR